MSLSCIYKISSKAIPSRIYIGSAVIFERRKWEHITDLRANRHHSEFLQRHANKHGIDDLMFQVVEEVTELSELIKREQYFIDTLMPHFNMCKVAGSSLGYRHTEETRRRMSLSHIGKTFAMSEGQKKKLSELKKGTKHTEATKLKMSLARRGELSHRLGKIMSVETRQKISKANTGRKGSEEFKEARRKAMMGNKYSRRQVLDAVSGHVYESIKQAASAVGMNLSTLKAMLCGRNTNKTNLSLIEKIEKYSNGSTPRK